MGKTWLVKRRFQKRVCFLIVHRNVVTVIVMDKFSQSIQNPFIAANLLRVLRVRDVCAHVLTKVSAFQISFLLISLNKSQTPWDQDALPSYYVLGCRRVCEHIQEFSASLRVSTCFGFVIYWTSRKERFNRFLWQNPLCRSWRKDVMVMCIIIHSRLFVQWFWEKTVLVNQVG